MNLAGIEQVSVTPGISPGFSLDHIDWFEVVETRGEVKDGTITYYQVTVQVGFRLNNDAD